MSTSLCRECGAPIPAGMHACPNCHRRFLDDDNPYAPPPPGELTSNAALGGKYSIHDYRDAKSLTFWTCLLMAFSILAVLALLGNNIMTHLSLSSKGVEATQEEFTALIGNNLATVAVIFIPLVILAIVQVIVFLCWVYRVCRNAHGMSHHALSTSPGWAVGFYFIPIFNFFKPYMAIQDTYRSAIRPDNWKEAPRSQLILWWWLLGIGNYLFGQIATRLHNVNVVSPDVDAFIRHNLLDAANNLISVLVAVMAIMVVRLVYTTQHETYRKLMDGTASSFQP